MLSVLSGFLKGSKEGGERPRGCAGGRRRGRGAHAGCAVTSRPISAAILDYLVAPGGRGGLQYRPDAVPAHFSGETLLCLLEHLVVLKDKSIYS